MSDWLGLFCRKQQAGQRFSCLPWSRKCALLVLWVHVLLIYWFTEFPLFFLTRFRNGKTPRNAQRSSTSTTRPLIPTIGSVPLAHPVVPALVPSHWTQSNLCLDGGKLSTFATQKKCLHHAFTHRHAWEQQTQHSKANIWMEMDTILAQVGWQPTVPLPIAPLTWPFATNQGYATLAMQRANAKVLHVVTFVRLRHKQSHWWYLDFSLPLPSSYF